MADTVDPVVAQWLQDEGLWSLVEDAPAIVRWAVGAITSERMTSIAFKVDADAEAARQLAFMIGPLVIDEHIMLGEWRRYRGQVITITGDKLGYGGGVNVFVLAVQDNLGTGLSTVTVLRRL